MERRRLFEHVLREEQTLAANVIAWQLVSEEIEERWAGELSPLIGALTEALRQVRAVRLEMAARTLRGED